MSLATMLLLGAIAVLALAGTMVWLWKRPFGELYVSPEEWEIMRSDEFL
jgi:hypothetical protein